MGSLHSLIVKLFNQHSTHAPELDILRSQFLGKEKQPTTSRREIEKYFSARGTVALITWRRRFTFFFCRQ